MADRPVRTALTIAGSDSGGGAGVQADLKAFARCGVHGMSAITAVTWQNTIAVDGVTPLPGEAIIGQVRAVAADLGVDAVKTGMLGDEQTIDAVVEALALIADAPLVVDPVMVAESGAVLLDPAARRALVERLLPRAAVVTPNVPEARALTGLGEGSSQAELASAVLELGPRAVVVTGGHLDAGIDLFDDGSGPVEIAGERHADGAAHGSGCTHSAALAAFLARGDAPLEAARKARVIASDAVRDGLRELGAGAGPVDALDIRRRRSSFPDPA